MVLSCPGMQPPSSQPQLRREMGFWDVLLFNIAAVLGPRWAPLADNRAYLLGGSLVLLGVAVGLNIVGLNVGKWLQNAGGVGTYVPLLMLVALGIAVWTRHGSVTQFTWAATLPRWDWKT